MVPLHTRFTDPAAVETWDASFRWRQGDVLRDVTVDDTWWRVATAIAAAEGTQAPLWAQRYAQAFSRWRLLPGESLLRSAGTGEGLPCTDAPAAVLNVAEFISLPLGAAPALDRVALVDAAALAVRMLDDAVMSGVCVPPPDRALEIGLMGIPDALAKLRVPYASAAAREHAMVFACAVAEGALRGTVELAAERGATLSGFDCIPLVDTWRMRGMPVDLIERALIEGVRHPRLTALRPHPLLARLANGVCEGLAPPMTPGFARFVDPTLESAREELNRAVQPWLDSPALPAATSAGTPQDLARSSATAPACLRPH